MKVALIGSTGLVGSAIKKELQKQKIDSLLLTHDKFDISNRDDFNQIKAFGANVVINTAAFMGVEPCENSPIEAFKINTQSVGELARFCEKNGMVLAHISSDSVFDGKDGLYDENATPNPINMYGLTKYGGEQLVKALIGRYYIFRLPILFGPRENRGDIFIEKMYKLYLNGNKNLKIADDVVSRPSYSVDIGKRIVDLILNRLDYGVYHLYNMSDGVSLYDFAKEFFRLKDIDDIEIKRAKAADFAKNEKGKKPLNTALVSVKMAPLRDWKDAMKAYIKGELNE